jgi:hypothetical protein
MVMFLAGFTTLIVVVSHYFLIPALLASNGATAEEKRHLQAFATLLLAVVLFMLAVDLGVFNRKSHVVSFKEAAVWSGVWVALAMIFLAIIAVGAVPAFLDGIHLGMDIADTYRGTGGAHTIWAGVLYVTSLAAVGGIVEVGIYRLRRSARSRFRKKSVDR